ncbi:MAG: hypothetical protein RJA49_1980 [Actinomycetota bacterium]|jgi:hypothetical protein
MAASVRVTGLRELRRDLKAASNVAGSKELRKGLRDATSIVAVDARNRASAFSRRAASSIAAGVAADRGYVAGGRKSIGWYGWADFGSRTPRRGNPRSKGPWAGSGKGPPRGRFIYAAIDAKETEVVAAIRGAVDDLLRNHDL